MSINYSWLAVVGPIAPRFASVAGSCADCAKAPAAGGQDACPGFGPGCLVPERAEKKESKDRY